VRPRLQPAHSVRSDSPCNSRGGLVADAARAPRRDRPREYSGGQPPPSLVFHRVEDGGHDSGGSRAPGGDRYACTLRPLAPYGLRARRRRGLIGEMDRCGIAQAVLTSIFSCYGASSRATTPSPRPVVGTLSGCSGTSRWIQVPRGNGKRVESARLRSFLPGAEVPTAAHTAPAWDRAATPPRSSTPIGVAGRC